MAEKRESLKQKETQKIVSIKELEQIPYLSSGADQGSNLVAS
jgi:hypothetical protein